jgi:hypothetical protein
MREELWSQRNALPTIIAVYPARVIFMLIRYLGNGMARRIRSALYAECTKIGTLDTWSFGPTICKSRRNTLRRLIGPTASNLHGDEGEGIRARASLFISHPHRKRTALHIPFIYRCYFAHTIILLGALSLLTVMKLYTRFYVVPVFLCTMPFCPIQDQRMPKGTEQILERKVQRVLIEPLHVAEEVHDTREDDKQDTTTRAQP